LNTTVQRLSVVFLALLLSACNSESTPLATGTSDYIDLSGNSGNFSDHRGKWMFINYWATWCKPCIDEIPELNHFASDNADRAVVFAVDFDNAQGEKLLASSQKLGIEFPVLIEDPHLVLGVDKPYALPTTFVFDPQGELQHTLLGPQTAASLAAAMVVIEAGQ
jgi:thiol-disulfide isomerase/thioredoxin